MADRTFDIGGRVVEQRNGRGLPGLTVVASSSLFELSWDTVTNRVGDFKLTIKVPSDNPELLARLEILFKVLAGGTPLESNAESIRLRPATENEPVLIEVKRDIGPPDGNSTEIVLHELGQGIAISVAVMQRELDRYPNTLGAYLLDEVELELPVRMRVDRMGQVLTTVVEDTKAAQVGRLRLRVRPVLGACQPPVVSSDQTLEALQALSPEEIAQLALFRIYSVDDLLRVGSTSSGRSALTDLQLRTQAADLLSRAQLLVVPVFPRGVAESLLKIGVVSVEDFVRRDPRALAEKLTGARFVDIFGKAIAAEEIESWQRELHNVLAAPSRTPMLIEAETEEVLHENS